ncbi:APC family permease [Lacrimispora xylanisolvens]|uniref:APC family permease n=1 Tax=Lacrimispora xylanisolvens TaxID=384636 RepID=UPI003D9C7DFA
MESKLEKKYGLFTAIAMVVGIVIGSGVFFKAEKILTATGGNLKQGILAWIIGGIIMISCAYTFSVMATKYQYINGIVDYAEATVGKKYAYYVGSFMAIIYYPTITSVLAWVSARYTCVIFGFSITGGECMTIACLYLVSSFTINALSPVLAGKFQVSTTVIKLIPLFLMAIVGTFTGLRNGMTAYNFTHTVSASTANGLFTAVVAASFAYEGWIIATCINAELRNAKRNLPLALISGTLITMAAYILYYIGLAGTVKNEIIMAGGEAGAKLAFQTVFTSIGGNLLFVFVIISCLGTLNGLMLGCTREFILLLPGA